MNVQRINMEAADSTEQFCASLKDSGFAVLYNHPIDKQLIHEVYLEWMGFFDSEQKKEAYFNQATQDGYFPASISETAKNHSQKDLKEYFQYYPWGQFPKQLSDNTARLFSQLEDLAQTLLHWVEAGLPDDIAAALSEPLAHMIKDTNKTMLRILHYPALTGNEPAGAVRAAAHADINLLTLLVGATERGLQVKDANGDWRDVPTSKDAIAVNIGDMLAMCTQYYYRSTTHRVINPEGDNRARLSMPLFLHPRSEVMLKPGFSAGEYLNERLTELGVK